MKKVLVLTEQLPDPTRSSAERRLWNLIELLAEQSEVTVGTRWPQPLDARPHWTRMSGARIAAWDGRWLENLLAQDEWDVCIVEYWFFAEPLIPKIRSRCPNCTVVVDSVDIHFRREQEGVELGAFDQQEVNDRKARELSVYRKADSVIVVTLEDEAFLRHHQCETPTVFIPNIIEVQDSVRKPEPETLVFVGTFYHHPNIDGLTWFLTNCWDEIRAKKPGCTLRVVGPHAPDDLRDLMQRNGVQYLGYVEKLHEIMQASAASIAPLRYGAGMKGKVCEALMHGLPLITTTVGAEGLRLENGMHALVADRAEDFSNAVITTLSDPANAEAMGSRGRQAAEKVVSKAAVSGLVQESINAWTSTANTRLGTLRWLSAKLGYGVQRQLRWIYRRLRRAGRAARPSEVVR